MNRFWMQGTVRHRDKRDRASRRKRQRETIRIDNLDAWSRRSRLANAARLTVEAVTSRL